MQRWGIFLGCFIIYSGFAAPGEIDPTFKPKLPTNFTIGFVVEQADGRLVIGGSFASTVNGDTLYSLSLLRLCPNGKIDRTFRPTRGNAEFTGSILDVAQRPDGTIGVVGRFNPGHHQAPRSAVVFGRNGKPTSYSPSVDFSLGAWLPDGGIVFDATVYPSNPNYYDPLYYGQLGTLAPDGTSPALLAFSYARAHFAWIKVLSDGHILANFFTRRYGAGSSRWLVYSSRWGEISFAAVGNYYPLPIVCVGPTNSLYLGGAPNPRDLIRRLAGWQVDPSFNFQWPEGTNSSPTIRMMTAELDGKIVYCASVGTSNHVYRCNMDGSDDPTFDIGAGPNASVQGIYVLHNRQLLVWGEFTQFNGTPVAGFVRLKSE